MKPNLHIVIVVIATTLAYAMGAEVAEGHASRAGLTNVILI
jgi:hypothetical protein